MLSKVNSADSRQPYMAGYDFSLADIAAVVNVHRYMLLELNIKAHAALLDWYQRLSERGSFKRWITAY